jgi:hypothetical protein
MDAVAWENVSGIGAGWHHLKAQALGCINLRLVKETVQGVLDKVPGWPSVVLCYHTY